MISRLPSPLGFRPTLGGQLLAHLLAPSAKRRTRGRRRILPLAVLLVLAAAPASAQRGRTSGTPQETRRSADPQGPAESRKPAEESPRREERAGPARTETPREGTRTETARPNRESTARTEAQPPARRDETRRTTEPRPGSDTGTRRTTDDQRRAEEARHQEDSRRTEEARRATEARRVEDQRRTEELRRQDDARRQEEARRVQEARTSTARTSPGGPRVVTVPAVRDERRWDPNVRIQPDRYGYDRRDDRYRGRPTINVDINWPWEQRYRSGWSARYRYRQTVYAESGYGRDRYDTRYEVRAVYRQRVLSASASRAQVELLLDELEVYQNGRYVGRITRLPSGFERIRATLYRNGRADFEKELYVVGDARDGFEIVATRGYDGYAFARWRRGDELRAAYLDFRSQRAEPVGRSRFFDPYDYRGYTPVAILPDDADWLGDFGPYSASAYPYYGGGYDRGYYGSDYGRDAGYYYGTGGVRPRYDVAPRGATSGSGEAADDRRYSVPRGSDSGADVPTLRRDSDRSYTTQGGATVRLRRESEIERVE